MTPPCGDIHSGFHAPTDYKARFERERHRRQALERRVEALELERDALKWRLHVGRTREA